MKKRIVALATIAGAVLPMQSAFGDGLPLSIQLQIGTPGYVAPPPVYAPAYVAPPPVVLPSPPVMVWMPGLQVYVAMGSPYPIFYLDNAYYYWHGGGWYRGPGYAGPWAPIRVPPPGLRGFHGRDWPVYQRRVERYYPDPHYRHFRAYAGPGRPDERGPEYGRGGPQERGPGYGPGGYDPHGPGFGPGFHGHGPDNMGFGPGEGHGHGRGG